MGKSCQRCHTKQCLMAHLFYRVGHAQPRVVIPRLPEKIYTNHLAVLPCPHHWVCNVSTRTDRSWRSEGPLCVCWRPNGTFWSVFLSRGRSVWCPSRCGEFWSCQFGRLHCREVFGPRCHSWVGRSLHCWVRYCRLCILSFHSWWCFPNSSDLQTQILRCSHHTMIHPSNPRDSRRGEDLATQGDGCDAVKIESLVQAEMGPASGETTNKDV